jgi:cytochrome c biogenesis protein CcmG/thiol:disulfide interchange protein DsbE
MTKGPSLGAFADRDSSAPADVCEAVGVRRALPFLALAALVAVLVIGLTQAGGGDGGDGSRPPSSAESARELTGAPPPLAALYGRANAIEPAEVDDLRGQLRELRGHPVVVNAWASWCGPCKLEFPFFQKAAARLGTEVAFFALNVEDNRENAAKFLKGSPVPYPSLEDGDGKLLREAAPGTRGLPVTIFYGADGERKYIHQGGYSSEEKLLEDIERHARA